MFTGIIQNLGIVKGIAFKGKSARLNFAFGKSEKKTSVGESIAVNGVCLTAIGINARGFSADILPETLEATNLGQLTAGDTVNLERSLKKGDAIGGHFITGHVDAVGKIAEIEKRGGNWSLLVKAPATIISRLAVKGSVACDGISLTVQEVRAGVFRTAIIPHTLEATNLKFKKAGSLINLEIDMLMRYLEKIRPKKSFRLTAAQLRKQGF